MIVHCQTCDTDFNLDESNLPPEGAWVRCSVCGEVFKVDSPSPAPDPPTDQTGPSPLDLQDYQDTDRQRAQELADFGLEQEVAAQQQTGRGPVFKFIFWTIGILLLLAMALLGGVVVMDRMGVGGPLVERIKALPGLSQLMGQIQAGREDSGQREAPVRMTLDDVKGYFRNNESAGRIFVIQGMVSNHHSQPRQAVLVQGRLHNAQGKVARQATAYAGAVFTPEEMRHLSLAAIQRRLSSPKSADGRPYLVGTDKSIPFVVVLANLPGQMMEFTAEVVASEPALSMGDGN
jgi:predicted Zn finger-like uncharacterized protein